jgi:hypothetical protein
MRFRLLHPFLFATLPILTVLAGNIEVIAPWEAARPIAIALLGASVLWLAARLVLKDWEPAASATSLLLVLFYAYGHVARLLGLLVTWNRVQRHFILIPVFVAVLAFLAWAVIRDKRRSPTVTRFLGITSAIWLAIPLSTIALHEVRLTRPWIGEDPPLDVGSWSSSVRPDIYYLIVDGYGREDVLRDLYGFDNRAFLGSLEEMGFQVVRSSFTNYSQTVLSLASSLNMRYLDQEVLELGADSQDVEPMARLVRYSQVRRTLGALGYATVAYATGYRRTEIENADEFLGPTSSAVSTLESLLVETCGAVALVDLARESGLALQFPGYQAQRERIDYVLDDLPQLARQRQAAPRFVFAHLILPHPPFVYRADGGPADQDTPYELADASYYAGGRHEYMERYIEQLVYLNGRLQDVLADLISSSSQPPIILLQADHGPGATIDWWQEPDDTGLWERMSILSAFYLPDAGLGVPSDLSPVNSFRLTFNVAFGAALPLLPDRALFSSVRLPYDLTTVPQHPRATASPGPVHP